MTEPESPSQDTTMVEKVAQAIYMSAVKQAQEQIGTEVLPTGKIVTVFEKAVAASDREASIVIFCLVDDLATDFFRRILTGKVSSGTDETFLAGNGMLSSAYSKIALLAGLEWITNETYRSLTLMRKIRNEFAHHVEYSQFSDRPISNYIDSMHTRENDVLQSMDADKRPIKLVVRSKFLVRSALAVFGLVREMTTSRRPLPTK